MGLFVVVSGPSTIGGVVFVAAFGLVSFTPEEREEDERCAALFFLLSSVVGGVAVTCEERDEEGELFVLFVFLAATDGLCSFEERGEDARREVRVFAVPSTIGGFFCVGGTGRDEGE